MNKTTANFWKKMMTVNSINVAAEKVVIAAAKTDGPMLNSAYRVRSPRLTDPEACA